MNSKQIKRLSVAFVFQCFHQESANGHRFASAALCKEFQLFLNTVMANQFQYTNTDDVPIATGRKMKKCQSSFTLSSHQMPK